MFSTEVGDETVRATLAAWETADENDKNAVRQHLQSVIDAAEVPPILYDQSQYRPATQQELQLITVEGAVLLVEYMPDIRDANAAGLFVATKNNVVHSAFAYSRQPNLEYPLAGTYYDAPVILFGSVMLPHPREFN